MTMNKRKWAGIPWEKRYSQSTSAPVYLVKKMREIDDLLDLKFYLPTECWHVVRYLGSRDGRFTRCWECNNSPGKHRELGIWIIDALHKGDTWKRDIVGEVDKANDELKASMDRETEAQAKDAAKNLAPLFKKWEEAGPNSDFHYNYAVGFPTVEQKTGFTITDRRKCI